MIFHLYEDDPNYVTKVASLLILSPPTERNFLHCLSWLHESLCAFLNDWKQNLTFNNHAS